MKKTLPLLLIGITASIVTEAQFTRYLVKFRHKGGTPFTLSNPSAYLTQRSIDRRTRYGIAYDSTDLPVNPSFVSQLDAVPNVTVLNVSKWLNSVSIQTTDPSAITTISNFSFVQSVSGLAARMNEAQVLPSRDKFGMENEIEQIPLQRPAKIAADYFNYGTNSFNEIHLHNGEFLHNIGLRGQGMQIAMLDAGFTNYLTLDAFDSAVANNQILGTWDFVSRNADVNDHPHGMQCFSTIAANIPGQFVGKAPKASFYLYRTEDAPTEYPIEEHNWSCGAEKADSLGVEVISTSLGYTTFDNASLSHTYADMNGNTTMAAIAADLAAKKGILVFAAIGNDGGNSWNMLSTPSDGDSVIAVGAVSITGAVGGFSSFGPSSDGQVKPDMASIGVSAIIQTTSNTVGSGNGTSFACPNMAGLGTCLWQGFPEFNNIRILKALQQAGNIFSAPNNRIGYGIPNVKSAFTSLLTEYATSSATISTCDVTLNWHTKDVGSMRYEIERKTPADANFVKIADVASQGGPNLDEHSYVFNNTLVNVPAGVVSYRIRQIVDTASASFTAAYIDTSTVNCPGCHPTGVINPNPNKEFVTVYPNPSNGQATLVIETLYAVPDLNIKIYDMKGSLVYELKDSKTTGRRTIELPLNKLMKGKYFIKVYGRNKIIGGTDLILL